MKKCKTCLSFKDLSEFYDQKGNKDGKAGRCKECAKSAARKRYFEKYEEIREYEKNRARLPHRVKARKEYSLTKKGKEAKRR